MVALKMLLSPISLSRKANILKIGGSLGGAAVATVVLELAAQAIVRASSQAASVGAGSVPVLPGSSLPSVGAVTIKDVPSLIPALAGGIAVLKGRTKVGLLMIVGSLAAKTGLRAAGINPDEFGNRLGKIYDKYIKKYSATTSSYEDDYYEPEVYF